MPFNFAFPFTIHLPWENAHLPMKVQMKNKISDVYLKPQARKIILRLNEKNNELLPLVFLAQFF